MTPNTHAERLLLGLARVLQGIDGLLTTEHIQVTTRTSSEHSGNGEIRLAWTTDDRDGGETRRYFRITVEEIR